MLISNSSDRKITRIGPYASKKGTLKCTILRLDRLICISRVICNQRGEGGGSSVHSDNEVLSANDFLGFEIYDLGKFLGKNRAVSFSSFF